MLKAKKIILTSLFSFLINLSFSHQMEMREHSLQGQGAQGLGLEYYLNISFTNGNLHYFYSGDPMGISNINNGNINLGVVNNILNVDPFQPINTVQNPHQFNHTGIVAIANGIYNCYNGNAASYLSHHARTKHCYMLAMFYAT